MISIFAILVAIYFGPVAAVQIDRWLSSRKENRNRKLDIFKTLMATRGSILSYKHVEALNRIDLEFSDHKKYAKIIDAWKEYFDNLGQGPTREEIAIWNSKNNDLLADLLLEMGSLLGYKFDKLLIKRNIYSPVGHADDSLDNQFIRKGIVDILNGNKSLPFELIQNAESDISVISKQLELTELIIEYFKKLKKVESKQHSSTNNVELFGVNERQS